MNVNLNKELLKEIERNLLDKKISRLDLLKLAGIDYCLACKRHCYNERTTEGYCFTCEEKWQEQQFRIFRKESNL